MRSLGWYPLSLCTGLPLTNKIKVGTPITPYCMARLLLSSTSNLKTFTLPSHSCESCVTTGSSILHGPHQVAVKSTITGIVDLSTSDLKTVSFNFGISTIDTSSWYKNNHLDINKSCDKSQDLYKPTEHDRIFFAKRACSSMVEQWPFKPLVERSS